MNVHLFTTNEINQVIPFELMDGCPGTDIQFHTVQEQYVTLPCRYLNTANDMFINLLPLNIQGTKKSGIRQLLHHISEHRLKLLDGKGRVKLGNLIFNATYITIVSDSYQQCPLMTGIGECQ